MDSSAFSNSSNSFQYDEAFEFDAPKYTDFCTLYFKEKITELENWDQSRQQLDEEATEMAGEEDGLDQYLPPLDSQESSPTSKSINLAASIIAKDSPTHEEMRE